MRSGEFIFNNINFYEHRVYIQERPEIAKAERNETEISIPGRNLPLTKWDNTYLPIEFTLSLFLKATNPEQAIEEYNWISSKLRTSTYELAKFYFDERYYYSVKFTEITLTYQTQYIEGVPFTAKVKCSPIKFDLSGIYPQSFNNPSQYYNTGTIISQPLIEFAGSGDITFWVNGNEFIFKGLLNGEYGMDSEIKEVYQIVDGQYISINSKYFSKSHFPELEIGENTISWTGNVTSAKLTPRWGEVI